jgi:hypothetical protein
MVNEKWSLPSTVGFAGDLMIPPSYPNMLPIGKQHLNAAIYLADLLLLYETVLIRCDPGTLHFLYMTLEADELEPLLKQGRIRFFTSMCPVPGEKDDSGGDLSGPIRKGFDALHGDLDTWFHSRITASKILGQVEDHLVERQTLNATISARFVHELMASLRPEFWQLRTPRRQERYHEVGFREGIRRLVDIWSTGTLTSYFDPEMLNYLSFCEINRSAALKDVANSISNPIDALHEMHNLPSARDMVIKGQIDQAGLLRLALSDDAANLRTWLRANLKPGVDVKDAYVQSLGLLPSKQHWVGWLRFGTVSLLSAGLGFLLSGSPPLASAFGLAVGASNVAWGAKVIEKVLDPYHPREWIQSMKTGTA